jgi:hypothetical protein
MSPENSVLPPSALEDSHDLLFFFNFLHNHYIYQSLTEAMGLVSLETTYKAFINHFIQNRPPAYKKGG